jgi:hypothetical protein
MNMILNRQDAKNAEFFTGQKIVFLGDLGVLAVNSLRQELQVR